MDEGHRAIVKYIKRGKIYFGINYFHFTFIMSAYMPIEVLKIIKAPFFRVINLYHKNIINEELLTIYSVAVVTNAFDLKSTHACADAYTHTFYL